VISGHNIAQYVVRQLSFERKNIFAGRPDRAFAFRGAIYRASNVLRKTYRSIAKSWKKLPPHQAILTRRWA
jgi:hypothetical protein